MDIIVINGFLGSGKTTLCQRILDDLKNHSVAVLVNEFGKLAIDDKRLIRPNIIVEEIHNGSILCSCKSDKFVEVVLKLLTQPFDFILVETSGFTNPDSLDRIMNFIREKSGDVLKRIHSITIIDPHMLKRLWNTMPVIQKQVEVADVILVNKVDLCNEEELSFTKERIKEVQPFAQVLYCEYAVVNISNLLSVAKTHKNSVLKNHKGIDFSTLLIQLPEVVKENHLHEILLNLLSNVYRVKGYIRVDTGMYYIQVASGQILYEHCLQTDQKLVVLYSSKQIGKKDILAQFRNIAGNEAE